MENLTNEAKLKLIQEFQELVNNIYSLRDSNDDESENYKIFKDKYEAIKKAGIIENIFREAIDIDTQFTFKYSDDIDYIKEDILAAFNEYEEHIIEDQIDAFSISESQDGFNNECHHSWLMDEINDFCALDNDNPIITKGYMKKVEYAMNLDRGRKEASHDNFELKEGRGYNSYIGTLNHKLYLSDDTVGNILYALENNDIPMLCDNIQYGDWKEYYEAMPILNEWCESISRAFKNIDITDTINDRIREWIEENNIQTSREITDNQVKARLEAGLQSDTEYLRNKITLPSIYNGKRWTSNVEEIKRTIQHRQEIIQGATTGDKETYEKKTLEMMNFIPKLELAIKERDAKNNIELAEQIYNNNDKNIYRQIAYRMAEEALK